MLNERNRHWIVTLNNPEETLEEFSTRLGHHTSCSVAQLERGEEGTPHFQAYLRFKEAKTMLKVKKVVGQRAHVEKCVKPLESWEYCQKEETRIEGPLITGSPPKPRKNVKGDTAKFNELCLTVGPERMVADNQLSLRDYSKVVKSIQLYKLNVDDPPALGRLENLWIWGQPGVGKSFSVRETWPNLFDKSLNKWWDGY